jgi:hypothetical protein
VQSMEGVGSVTLTSLVQVAAETRSYRPHEKQFVPHEE